ncbi:MAG: response regulator transcription factor, partial [Tannerellaceae bacterium]|nr:response regulator transcription factor [Tannerellaceae bacterium]
MISVGIIDDHKVVVEGLEFLINQYDGIEVTAKAHSAAEGLQMLSQSEPDVLLLDVSLPDGNGIDLCKQIKSEHPNLKILMLTSYSEIGLVMRALENGASAYVLKTAMIEEVREGILALASGERFFCDEADVLMKRRSEPHPVRLSRRETELLGHIVAGLSNSEI